MLCTGITSTSVHKTIKTTCYAGTLPDSLLKRTLTILAFFKIAIAVSVRHLNLVLLSTSLPAFPRLDVVANVFRAGNQSKVSVHQRVSGLESGDRIVVVTFATLEEDETARRGLPELKLMATSEPMTVATRGRIYEAL